MSAWRQSLLVVGLVSAIPLIGMLVLARRPTELPRHLARLVPCASGALIGAALLHLLPEALARSQAPGRVALLVALGSLGFFAIDRALHGRIGGAAPHGVTGPPVASRLRQLVPATMAGDALHNVIDGVLIASAFLDEPSLGLLTGAAIALHELPRELGTFALLVGGGMPVRRAILFNALTGAGAVAGAMATLVLGSRVSVAGMWLLPVAAGNFLYLGLSIAAAECRSARSLSGGLAKLGLAAAGMALTALGAHAHQ